MFRSIIKSNLIRIGSRLSKTHLPYESKHQILLNKDHPLSRIIFCHYNENVHHAGREQTLAESREKVWIVKGRGLLKMVIKDFLHCKRLHTKPIAPLMVDLPCDRIKSGQPPFYNTRIDYFELILTKQSRRTRSTTRKMKWWGALFACLNTQAVDLELNNICVYISTHKILFKKRVSTYIQSDNGKNFVGTETVLNIVLKNIDTKRIEKEVNSNQTKCLFNPPCSPWMSWAMESMIKITKCELKIIIKERTFTDDALYTIMANVESAVHS